MGPSLPRTETVQWGHKRPSFALLHPPLCSSSLRRPQLCAHTWQCTLTNILLLTGQAGGSFHPRACCAHPWRRTHIRSQVNTGLRSAALFPSPRHLTLPPVELFSLTRSTMYLYYPAINRPLATAQLPPSVFVHIMYFSHRQAFFFFPQASHVFRFLDVKVPRFVRAVCIYVGTTGNKRSCRSR